MHDPITPRPTLIYLLALASDLPASERWRAGGVVVVVVVGGGERNLCSGTPGRQLVGLRMQLTALKLCLAGCQCTGCIYSACSRALGRPRLASADWVLNDRSRGCSRCDAGPHSLHVPRVTLVGSTHSQCTQRNTRLLGDFNSLILFGFCA